MNGQADLTSLILILAPTAEEISPPLPEGVFHLLIVDKGLVMRAHRRRITLCGAVVQPAGLPPSCFEEVERDPQYCAECVREAIRWSAGNAGAAQLPRIPAWGCPVSEHREDLAPEEPAKGEIENPLPEGVFHLISAHEVTPRWRLHPTYFAVCGAQVETASTPEVTDCPNECECEFSPDMAYCSACLRAALEQNRRAGGVDELGDVLAELMTGFATLDGTRRAAP